MHVGAGGLEGTQKLSISVSPDPADLPTHQVQEAWGVGTRCSGQCVPCRRQVLPPVSILVPRSWGPLWGGQQPGLSCERAVSCILSFAPPWAPNLSLPSPAHT